MLERFAVNFGRRRKEYALNAGILTKVKYVFKPTDIVQYRNRVFKRAFYAYHRRIMKHVIELISSHNTGYIAIRVHITLNKLPVIIRVRFRQSFNVTG